MGVLDLTARGFTPVSFNLMVLSGRPPKGKMVWGRAGPCCCPASPQRLVGLGGHQLVELGVAGERVLERHDVPGTADEAAPRRHIGDVPQLGIGDVQQLRQLVPVGGGLVQEDEELRVCQHQPCGVRLEQFLHVLGQPRHQAVVLADALPQLVEEVGAVLVAEQQVKLIGEHPGGFALLPVLDDPVEDGVQSHQHANGPQLFPQLPDVVGEDAGLGVHVGGLGEGVEAAGDEQLRGERQSPGLRFRLLQEDVVQVFQGGRFPLVAAGHIVPVHIVGAAVQDGFLLGGHAARPHQLLKQGEDELRFFDQRVPLVPVGFVHVQGVDVGV